MVWMATGDGQVRETREEKRMGDEITKMSCYIGLYKGGVGKRMSTKHCSYP